jgi:hypothetical protein
MSTTSTPRVRVPFEVEGRQANGAAAGDAG